MLLAPRPALSLRAFPHLEGSSLAFRRNVSKLNLILAVAASLTFTHKGFWEFRAILLPVSPQAQQMGCWNHPARHLSRGRALESYAAGR